MEEGRSGLVALKSRSAPLQRLPWGVGGGGGGGWMVDEEEDGGVKHAVIHQLWEYF